MTRELRAVVVDDTPEFRALLVQALHLDGRVRVIAEAGDGEEGVRVATALRPDVVVLDLLMPKADGLEAATRIRQAVDVPVVLLTGLARADCEPAARAAGVDVVIEKGGDLDELVDAIASCGAASALRASEEARAAEVAVGAAAPRSAELPFGRWVEWCRVGAAVFAATQVLAHRPSPLAGPVLVPSALLAAGVAAALLLTNVLGRIGRVSVPRPRIAVVQVALDLAIVAALHSAYAADPFAGSWVILAIPLLEAGVVAGLRGAAVAWAAMAAWYAVHASTLAAWASGESSLTSATYRMGVLLLLTAIGGGLAEGLRREVAAHRLARAEAERRAELLGFCGAATRALLVANTPDDVVEAVVEWVRGLGFDAAQVSLFEETASLWRPAASVGLPEALATGVWPVSSGVVGLVRERREVVLVDYQSFEGGLPEIRALGYRAVAAAPVWVHRVLAGALIAGRLDDRTPDPAELEALELLANQVGAALRSSASLEASRHASLHDPLTGAANARGLRVRCTEAMRSAAKRGGRTGVLYVDLDGFKAVNDRLGHEAGDELLVGVARRLSSLVRADDTVARVGGDEFVVVIHDVADRAQLARIRDEVSEGLVATLAVAGTHVETSASVGAALYPDDAAQPADLLKAADRRMYEDKARNAAVARR